MGSRFGLTWWLLLCAKTFCCSHRLQQELELQQHSLQLLGERMAGSEGHQLAQALADTEGELKAAQEQAAAAADKKKEMVALAKVNAMSCVRMRVCVAGGDGAELHTCAIL